jgi:hypothetical protein
MPANGHKVLTAVLVAVFENIDGGSPLASNAKAFDVRIPDSLAGS